MIPPQSAWTARHSQR